jgi:glycosyltransferase involved in cell wall biosynthesis
MAGDTGGTDPEFTILLPTHARSDVITYAIRSVLAQQEQSFELLVVGDGAEDGTAQAVSAFKDERIAWMDLPKAPGFGYANRNVALRKARGRYVAFLSDDDLLFPDHLSLLKRQFEKGAVLVSTLAAWVSSDGIAAPFPNNLMLPDEAAVFTGQINSTAASCFAYRSDALDDPAAWPEDIEKAGDWHLWNKILAAHPEVPLAVSRTYSVLHFAARRLALRHSGMPELEVLLRYADHSDWWPDILRADLSTGLTEQAVYNMAIENGGSDTLRDALGVVVDRLAWELIQSHLQSRRRLLSLTTADRAIATSVPQDFDAATYKLLNPDVATADFAAENHWLRHGQFEDRKYRP